MTPSTFPRSRSPRRQPNGESQPTAAQIPEGVGYAAATAASAPIERAPIVTRAESAPCTCPEYCERDHEND